MKLNANIVQCLRRLRRHSWEYRVMDLAKEFGVYSSTMSNALRGVNWKKVPMYDTGSYSNGDNHGSSKLTSDLVYLLRVLRAWKVKPNNKSLAKEFGVYTSTMYYAINGTTWKKVPMYKRPPLRWV